METLVRAAPDAKLNDVKALLGQMMFSGDAMEKKVRIRDGLCGPLRSFCAKI